MCGVTRNKRRNLVYENETHKPIAFEDEPLLVHAQRLKTIINDYEHTFSETHRRVHYCHRGHNACPICPAIYAGETAADDLIEISAKLRKHKLRIICKKNKRNDGYQWVIQSTIN